MEEEKKNSVNNATESDPKSVFNRMATKDEIQRDFIERLEEHYDSKLISHKDVQEKSKDLYQWLKSISRYGNVDKTMIILKPNNDHFDFTILFFTFEHNYRIAVCLPKGKDEKGYLGCTASTRKNRVGEWWNRGNDLPDGEFSYKTWKKIVNGIVSYEIKNLQIDKTKIE